MFQGDGGFVSDDVAAFGAGNVDAAEYWTFDIVEARLIEAMRFAWRDEPGTWPFAGDGPWALMAAERGDYDARGGDMTGSALLPRLHLTRAERARMDQAVGWLAYVAGDGSDKMIGGDAKLIVRACRKLAAHRGEGRGQVRWMQLLSSMGVARGATMLSQRYSRAMARICAQLVRDGVPVDLAREG